MKPSPKASHRREPNTRGARCFNVQGALGHLWEVATITLVLDAPMFAVCGELNSYQVCQRLCHEIAHYTWTIS
eukprot:3087123-Prorocentrum_lima.AAC.1